METKQMAMRARQAAYEMANLNAGIRNAALMGIADALDRNSQALFEANRTDLVRSQADGLATSLLKRLKFDQEKIVRGSQRTAQSGRPARPDRTNPAGHSS